MKKGILSLILVVISTISAFSQGPSPFYFQHYQYNLSVINPALTAQHGGRTLSFMGNFQNHHNASNYGGALFSYERASYNNNNGAGILAYSNYSGGNTNRALGGSLRRRFYLGDDVYISVGARLNIHQAIFNNVNRVYSNLETGAAIQARNFYGGLNIFDVFSSGKVIFYNRINNQREDSRPQFSNRMYMVNAGYKLGINDFISTDYNLVFRGNSGFTSVDFHNNFLLAEVVMAGFSVLNLNNFNRIDFALNAGVNIKQNFQLMFLCYSARRNNTARFPSGELFLKVRI